MLFGSVVQRSSSESDFLFSGGVNFPVPAAEGEYAVVNASTATMPMMSSDLVPFLPSLF